MAEEHVRGRMLLEENPGNRNPALPPQFDTTGKGDYRKVTPENPLPTANYVMSDSGLWIPEPEVRNTQLTGSIVEEVPIFNALSITDTKLVNSNELNLSKYKEVKIIFLTTLDQAVTVQILDCNFEGVNVLESTKESQVILTTGASQHTVRTIGVDEFPQMSVLNRAVIRVQCRTNAPESGSISVKLLGKLR